jgi:hypothetical protein
MGMSKDIFLQEQERESILTSDKAIRENFAKAVIQEVAEGNKDPQHVLIMAKKAVETFTLIEKNVKPYVAGKQIQKGGITLYNATIISKSDPDKYDFTVCEDPVWDDLDKQEKDIKARKKKREDFLKNLTEDMAMMDGVVIHPPSKTFGAENVSVTLK